ncbi:MAG TPA: hypothetical protein VN380_22515 [Thermoanaerobaculia bacterium]|jgi:hypothetical protein|nr:hypothetical protein [Thermoanaerobaculia bacterium]
MPFTAVAHPLSYRLQKRDALLFDSIGLVLLERNLRELPREEVHEVEWLLGKGVVQDVSLAIEAEDLPEGDFHRFHIDCAAYYLVNESLRQIAAGEYSIAQGLSERMFYEAADAFSAVWKLDPRDVAPVAAARAAAVLKGQRSLERDRLLEEAEIALKAGYDATARVAALCLTKRRLADAVPILAVSPIEEVEPPEVPLVPVVSIVLDGLPAPDPETPWEAVVDFRSDESAIQSLRRMRYWLRTFAAQDRSKDGSLAEIRGEIEHMVHECETFLQLHKIKPTRSRLEVLLAPAPEAADTMSQLRLEAAMNALFDVRKHSMSLYEVERSMPGREVAYLTDVRRRAGQAA